VFAAAVLLAGLLALVVYLVLTLGPPDIQKVVRLVVNGVATVFMSMAVTLGMLVFIKMVFYESGLARKVSWGLNRCVHCWRPIAWTEDSSDTKQCACGKYPELP